MSPNPEKEREQSKKVGIFILVTLGAPLLLFAVAAVYIMRV
jgi:hypothetical protein